MHNQSKNEQFMIKENFVEIYKNSFVENWDLQAMSDFSTTQSILYKDFAKEIAKLHLLFKEFGIKPQDKIALTGQNNISWCITYIATFTYGAVVVPILQDFHLDNIHHIINHSDSKLLFADNLLVKNIAVKELKEIKGIFSTESLNFECKYDGDSKCEGLTIDEITRLGFNNLYPNGFSKEDINYPNISNSEVVVINYTSGTTGFSKGVMLTANNLAGNVTHAKYLKLLFRGENILSFLPLAHAYGCAFEFLYALSAGAHITILGKTPAPQILLEAFKKVKPRLILTVPLILEKIYRNSILPKIQKPLMKILLKTPLVKNIIHNKIRKSLVESLGGNFHEIIIGGAALNKEAEAFFHKIKIPITVGYGMTECAPLISYDHNYDFIPTSCGKILDNIMQVRIDSSDPENVPGEIQVFGENVMKGYYKNEEATREVFTEDGWLKTGDLGTIDRNNRIYIRGRIKTMLLGSNGQNIYPEEIEAKFNLLDYTLETLVVQRSQKLVALIFADEERLQRDEISKIQLKDMINQQKNKINKQLNNYEKISSIEFVDSEFEKTPKKSIKRFLYK